MVEDTARLGVWTGGELNVAMLVLPNDPDQVALHSPELYNREYRLALAEAGIPGEGSTLLAATRGAHAVLGSEEARPGQAVVAARAGVAAGEHPGVRVRTVDVDGRAAHLLLAKNPAGWQEALGMIDTSEDGLVIAVNGQVPDGEDLSWLWDVRFEHFEDTAVVAAGERGTDLAVRLGYAGVEHTLVHDTVAAIASCPPGHVEVIANYTAFLQLNRALERRG